jgi:lipoprotein-anchoring transpeptidase ErfK/SrfK
MLHEERMFMHRPNLTANSKVLVSAVFGVALALSAAGGIASARTGVELPPSRDGLLSSSGGDQSSLPLTYAYVVTNNVQVYADPEQAAIGAEPVRSLGVGYLWVSLANARPVYQDGQAWYLINANEYVRADQLAIYRPSAFQGQVLPTQPDRPFGWMVYSVQASATPGAAPVKGAPLLTRYTPVTVFEEQKVGDWLWYRVGEDQWVEQRKVGLVTPSARPAGVGPGDKWIDVDLFEQTLAAYEGDRMVYATLVSSGLPQWATEQGLFRMWSKVKMAKMSGRDGLPDYYFLEDVPWTMYFNGATALHGAYWHDRFGFPHSHGCVNLAPKDAKWLYDWTTPPDGPGNWTLSMPETAGTWVRVRDSRYPPSDKTQSDLWVAPTSRSLGLGGNRLLVQ